MSDLDLSGLKSLRTGGEVKAAKTKKTTWEPLDLRDLQPGTYLACDQSLGATGLVLFEVMPERDRWSVHMAQKLDGGGNANWEEALSSAARLQALMVGWIHSWVIGTDWGDVKAVHEAPPIGGGRIMRPESSLLGAFAFRNAIGFPLLPMVRRQDHAKLICGNANAKKPIEHASLKQLFPQITGSELITNEAHRDALCVALAAARRGF